eukprot:Hpha_TRINITY_DN4175_c0_g1::TRINITY_DN4175_c0_g1_i1::g.194802::m.194802
MAGLIVFAQVDSTCAGPEAREGAVPVESQATASVGDITAQLARMGAVQGEVKVLWQGQTLKPTDLLADVGLGPQSVVQVVSGLTGTVNHAGPSGAVVSSLVDAGGEEEESGAKKEATSAAEEEGRGRDRAPLERLLLLEEEEGGLRCILTREEEVERHSVQSLLVQCREVSVPLLSLSLFASSLPQSIAELDAAVAERRHLAGQDPLVLADMVLLKRDNLRLRLRLREAEEQVERLGAEGARLQRQGQALKEAQQRAEVAQTERREAVAALDLARADNSRLTKELADLRSAAPAPSATTPFPGAAEVARVGEVPVEQTARGKELLAALATLSQDKDVAELRQLREEIKDLRAKGTTEQRERIARVEQQCKDLQRRAEDVQVQCDWDLLAGQHKLQLLERRVDSLRAAYLAVVRENARLRSVAAMPCRVEGTSSSPEQGRSRPIWMNKHQTSFAEVDKGRSLQPDSVAEDTARTLNSEESDAPLDWDAGNE